MGSLLKTLGIVNSSPINLLRNTNVYDRNIVPWLHIFRSGLQNHWSPVPPAVAADFNVYRSPNSIYFFVNDVGPDATSGSIYFDASAPARRFRTLLTKVSGDGVLTMTCYQISGSTKSTAATGNLTLESGTGGASIAWTSAPQYIGFAASVALVDGEYASSIVTECSLGVAVGEGSEQTLPFDAEPSLFPGAVVSFFIPVGVASAGTILKMDVLDQSGVSLGSSAFSTVAAESGVEVLVVENAVVPPGTTAFTFRTTIAAVPGVVYQFPPTLSVTPKAIPYRPRPIGPMLGFDGPDKILNILNAGTVGRTNLSLADLLPKNAVMVRVSGYVLETGTPNAQVLVRNTFSSMLWIPFGVSAPGITARALTVGVEFYFSGEILLDDLQQIAYEIADDDGLASTYLSLWVTGYREWSQ